ncbi:MAG: DegT/DnrJ/EryC1/StrS family aminotransferase [Deltaproteobacteria bacterium]|nr:DegT/DnrJ/EryC1/StrS family aminotransferase [Deltaproteobacteria bacterium]
MKVALLDLKRQYETVRDEIRVVTEEVFASQQFILGPKVAELEMRVAEYCRCEYAVGVSSGTDALLISLMCAGIGRGDVVITSPYTFFATAGAVARVGARPLFVDIEEHTYNMDPLRLEEAVARLGAAEKGRLKAIIPVHLYGQCADMEPILDVAGKHGLVVIEDAAQAIGSEYEWSDGKVSRAGSMGEYGCFSFFPSKNLGAFGDGGMVAVSSRELYDRLKILRVHGSEPKYYHETIGGNFRLDALQAAILGVKLKYLDAWTGRRVHNAKVYGRLFEAEGLSDIVLPHVKEKRHIYNQFVIKLRENRDEMRTFLSERGVGTEVYYPVPLHLQGCFRDLGYKEGDLPVAEEAAKKTLALPIYPELGEDEMAYVVHVIKEFVEKG